MSEINDRVKLCTLHELDNPGSKGFGLADDTGTTCDVFVVRQGNDVHAYLNSCPHTGGPLDWTPDQFLDEDNEFIMCATHSALFRIDDGLCVAGPCVEQGLTPLQVQLENGTIYLIR